MKEADTHSQETSVTDGSARLVTQEAVKGWFGGRGKAINVNKYDLVTYSAIQLAEDIR